VIGSDAGKGLRYQFNRQQLQKRENISSPKCKPTLRRQVQMVGENQLRRFCTGMESERRWKRSLLYYNRTSGCIREDMAEEQQHPRITGADCRQANSCSPDSRYFHGPSTPVSFIYCQGLRIIHSTLQRRPSSANPDFCCSGL
jgi:hypothetical protein